MRDVLSELSARYVYVPNPLGSAEEIRIMFWFIHDDGSPLFEGKGWNTYREQWLRRVPTAGRFHSIDGAVQTLDDLTAREYVESDPLDLDHLSVGVPKRFEFVHP